MIAFGALISILTFVGAVAFSVDRAIVQEVAFLENATEALEIDTSQQALAERLMDQAVEAVPLLALVRGAGERALVVILESGAFDQAIDTLVIDGHRHLMSAEGGPFVADLSDVRDVLVEPIARISPDLAERIPVTAFEEVTILEDEALSSVVRAARWAPVTLVLSAAAAVFLAVAVVMLARRRSLAVTMVGVAVLTAGGGVILWSAFSGSLAASRVDDPISRVLVENGYTVFSKSLTSAGVWLVVAGFVIAAAGLIGVLIGVARGTDATSPTVPA